MSLVESPVSIRKTYKP